VADLRKVMKLNRHNSLLKTGRIQESLEEHRAVMTALINRDAAETVKRMREHFANGWRPLPDLRLFLAGLAHGHLITLFPDGCAFCQRGAGQCPDFCGRQRLQTVVAPHPAP